MYQVQIDYCTAKNDKNELVFLIDDLNADLGDTGLRLGRKKYVKYDEAKKIVNSMNVKSWEEFMENTDFSELNVPGFSKSNIEELNERAGSIKELAGRNDVETFIGRLSSLSPELRDFEHLAANILNKPSKDLVPPLLC